jgi:hypothetical protein
VELWSGFQVISPGVQRGLPRVLAFGVVDGDREWIDGNIMLAVAHNLTDCQDHPDELAALKCQIFDFPDALTIAFCTFKPISRELKSAFSLISMNYVALAAGGVL